MRHSETSQPEKFGLKPLVFRSRKENPSRRRRREGRFISSRYSARLKPCPDEKNLELTMTYAESRFVERSIGGPPRKAVPARD
jgi:hypothetical protein